MASTPAELSTSLSSTILPSSIQSSLNTDLTPATTSQSFLGRSSTSDGLPPGTAQAPDRMVAGPDTSTTPQGWFLTPAGQGIAE